MGEKQKVGRRGSRGTAGGNLVARGQQRRGDSKGSGGWQGTADGRQVEALPRAPAHTYHGLDIHTFVHTSHPTPRPTIQVPAMRTATVTACWWVLAMPLCSPLKSKHGLGIHTFVHTSPPHTLPHTLQVPAMPTATATACQWALATSLCFPRARSTGWTTTRLASCTACSSWHLISSLWSMSRPARTLVSVRAGGGRQGGIGQGSVRDGKGGLCAGGGASIINTASITDQSLLVPAPQAKIFLLIGPAGKK